MPVPPSGLSRKASSKPDAGRHGNVAISPRSDIHVASPVPVFRRVFRALCRRWYLAESVCARVIPFHEYIACRRQRRISNLKIVKSNLRLRCNQGPSAPAFVCLTTSAGSFAGLRFRFIDNIVSAQVSGYRIVCHRFRIPWRRLNFSHRKSIHFSVYAVRRRVPRPCVVAWYVLCLAFPCTAVLGNSFDFRISFCGSTHAARLC